MANEKDMLAELREQQKASGEKFQKMIEGYRAPLSQAMEEFALEQCKKYWGAFQEWTSDDINRLLDQLFTEELEPGDIDLPDGTNYVGCPSGKIIALHWYLDLFLRAQKYLLPSRKPIVSVAVRQLRGEIVGKTYQKNYSNG
jgi:hypothetical protein